MIGLTWSILPYEDDRSPGSGLALQRALELFEMVVVVPRHERDEVVDRDGAARRDSAASSRPRIAAASSSAVRVRRFSRSSTGSFAYSSIVGIVILPSASGTSWWNRLDSRL